jgi:thiol-disulfide isomerase/thioredoxin
MNLCWLFCCRLAVAATPDCAATARADAVAFGIEKMQGEVKAALSIIGKPAPPITVDEWRGGPPPDWTGKVLLVRFWTVGCEFCEATAPALEDLKTRFGPKGLVVLPIHHPKAPEGKDMVYVEKEAKREGMPLPFAQDRDWRTIKSWWLTSPRPFTSATILVDRKGIIRYFHPGGEYHKSTDPEHARCASDRDRVEEFIKKLLAENKVNGR